MPTINQLIKKSRVKPVARNKVPALERQPLKRGVCVKVYTTTPKTKFGIKKLLRVRLSNGFEVTVHSGRAMITRALSSVIKRWKSKRFTWCKVSYFKRKFRYTRCNQSKKEDLFTEQKPK